MSDAWDVSVVVSTLDRCDILRHCLDTVLAQNPGPIRFEVIVVDNGSTDRTPAVLESYQRSHPNFRHLFEPRRGVSYGRNCGIAAARAPVIAFTDDDLMVSPDWVAAIRHSLDVHPEVDYVGGKVLPRPGQELPDWLTREHWNPITLRDPGEAPFYLNSANPICMGSGNLAMRADTLRQFQGFSGAFPRGQDRELQLRLWRAARQGMYDPALVVFANVQPERLTRAYHRQWYEIDGDLSAAIHDEEVERSRARLFDVPAHLYRQALADVLSYCSLRLRGRRDQAFFKELELRYFRAFYRRRRRDFLAAGQTGSLASLAGFIKALLAR